MTATIAPEEITEPIPTSWIFDISGMDCGDCARTIEGSVRRLPGVSNAVVNFGAATLTVQPESAAITAGAVVALVSRAGYRLVPRGERFTASKPWWGERRTLEIAASALLWSIAFIIQRTTSVSTPTLALYLASMAMAGYPVARAALVSLKARRADMNVLMSIAALGAIPLGEWEEGSSVLILFAFGLLLQSHAVERTRKAIQGLVQLAPDEANVLRPEGEVRLSILAIDLNERVIVRPGERIPVDGTVIAGKSEVDQSAITGESMPVEVDGGHDVFAGSLNGSGVLEVNVTKRAAESTISGIVRMVEQAQSTRAPAQAFVDRFAEIYTPAVVFAAILLSTIGTVVTGDAHHWIFQGLVLLVVACPCALVISTPVALVSAIGSAARRGILFKSGAAVEALASVKTVAFDKTGTLTHGRPEVSRIVPFGQLSGDEVLALAAAVEIRTNHPIARGIVRHAQERTLTLPSVTSSQSVTGKGASAIVSGRLIEVGSPRAGAIPADVSKIVSALEEAGETAILVSSTGNIIGVIGLIDRPRQVAAQVIERISALGIHPLILSGDSRRVADRIGRALAISDVRSELLPADKVIQIRAGASAHGVAMVGDGINDAPALAAATVGIAMGVGGSDIALEAADIALLADDLRSVPLAIDLSRSTMRIIRQNIGLALAVKAAFILLTVAGVTNLWLAVLADTGMSLLVTANALRLLRHSDKTTYSAG